MNKLTEVFLEGWDDITQVRENCNQRAVELENQGFHCTVGLYYNAATGNRIYLLEATKDDSSTQSPHQRSVPQSRQSLRPTRQQKR